MAYFPKTSVEYVDNGTIDAFGRLRVSSPYTMFDSKQIHDDRSIFWDVAFTNNATASYVQNRASTTLSVAASVGSKAIRQSKIRAMYQSGKSLLCITTQIFGAGSVGVDKRVGLFDEKNGIFLQQSNNTVYLVMRSYVGGVKTDTYVAQANWNIDAMDGNGISGILLDLSKASILLMDLQWLGVGRVRVGFEINGMAYYVHQFFAANIKDSVYMSTPNLPIRYEIENMSGSTTNTFEQICSTIASEGGYDARDVMFSVDRGITTLSGVTNAGLVPVVSIRLNPSYTGSYVVPVALETLCTTNNANYRWQLVMNPTYAGTNQPTYRNVLSSAVQYDINRNSTNTVTNGLVIESGYAISRTTNDLSITNHQLVLGSTIDGRTDEVSLCVQGLDATSLAFLGSITWKGST